MYTIPEARLKKVQDVKVPSMSELALMYGLKPVEGHPDNTDPDHFNTPDNLQGSTSFQRIKRQEAALNAQLEAMIEAQRGEAKEEPKNGDKSEETPENKDDKDPKE